MFNWYALYVNARHEKKIVNKLIEDAVHAYTPINKKLQQWSDRKKWIEFPLISGYIFVYIDLINKDKVLQTHGVLGFIKFEGKEAVIKEKDIAILKSVELCGYDASSELIGVELNQHVKIIQGNLKGLEGKIIQVQNENFVKIELTSIKQSIIVKVPVQILKLIVKDKVLNE